MRAENQIDIPHAAVNPRAQMLGQTAGEPDDQIRIFFLQLHQAAQFGKRLLFGFLTNRTGVDQNTVRLRGIFRLFVALLRKQNRHLLGVVDVHLTAERRDMQIFFSHAVLISKQGEPSINPSPAVRQLIFQKVAQGPEFLDGKGFAAAFAVDAGLIQSEFDVLFTQFFQKGGLF